MNEPSVVGKRVPRWNVHEKVTGAAKYTADVALPGMLVGKILFSPHAHARIVRIDKSKARALPGVKAVLSFADIPRKKYNPNKLNLILFHPETEIADMYVLSDKARYVGDRIAAVAAVDAATAERALSLIEVEYEVLPHVFDAAAAMAPGAPVVHDFAENNTAMHMAFPVAWGDVAQGFAEADVVAETAFKTSKQHMAQLEPCACVANFGADGRLSVWSPSQHAFLHRRKLAELFDLPEGKVKWITPHVGGAFGKYGSFGVEPVCAALSIETRRPVKISFSREEDMFNTETRQVYRGTVRVGLKRDGSITALEEKIISDGGAYFCHNSSATAVNMGAFTGLYRSPAVAAEADCVYTNLHPTGGVRGYGGQEATTMLEQSIDKAARALGLDPLEVRLKNVKKAGDPSSTGLPMETCTLDELMRLGAEKIGWKEKRRRPKENGARRYGIGMGIMMDVSGAQPFDIQARNAAIKFNEDGSINLALSACDMGQNLQGTMAQMAAEVLGIAYEDVYLITGDTDTTLFDVGNHASGGCYQMGNAVINAATEVRKKLLLAAGKQLGASPDALDVKNRQVFVRSDPAKAISVQEVVRGAMYSMDGPSEHISAKGSFNPEKNPPPFGVVFAEVDVDTETGVVTLLHLLYVFDCGRAINPDVVEGQLEGGAVQAVGYVLTEDYVTSSETGALLSNNFTTYKIPSTLDIPQIEVLLHSTPVPSGPFGAKGVGQGSMVAVIPAIANAIFDATGVMMPEMPITPEKIVAALRKQKETGGCTP